MLTGALIGFVVAVSMLVINRRKAKSGTGLPGQVEEALRAKGAPMTLKEVAEAVGKPSFMGRGEVVQALAALDSLKKIRTIPAPEGTPQLKKVDFIKYEALPPGAA